MTASTPQGIEIASAKKFCDFKAREGSPAAIFHENFEIPIFAPTLVCTNLPPRIFLGHRGHTITTSTFPSTN